MAVCRGARCSRCTTNTGYSSLAFLRSACCCVNGQWDPQVQQVVNGAIHAGTAALLAGMIWIAGGRKRIDLIALTVGIVFTLPFAWENTLAGFQSAFYFLLLFTVLALWLTIRHPAGSWRWLLGWLFALCSVFTSAGGLITPVALLVPPVLGFITGRQSWKELGLNIGAAIGSYRRGTRSQSRPRCHIMHPLGPARWARWQQRLLGMPHGRGSMRLRSACRCGCPCLRWC